MGEGQTAEVRPGHWHNWWNAADVDALVRAEVFPAERFMHGGETLFGLARLGYTNDKGMPNLLQMAMFAREFSDVIQLRNPPPQVQKIIFALLALVARPLGYRATTRSCLAPSTRREKLDPTHSQSSPQASGAARLDVFVRRRSTRRRVP